MRIARACAQALLSDLPEPPSRLGPTRLILTAVFLHLYPVVDPDPTLADVHAFLLSLATPDTHSWSAMAKSPLALVQYVAEDFNGGPGAETQSALSLAIKAVATKAHISR